MKPKGQILLLALATITSISKAKLKILLLTSGETPKAFIDGILISHACTLLLTTKKSVKDIAFSLGYSNDAIFRRLFKQKMKMAPSVYQQQRNSG
ncbi:MAG: AraC-like DNA-binding protein [Candidatus Endobugula sp.]